MLPNLNKELRQRAWLVLPGLPLVLIVLYGVELLDELIYGLQGAVLPLLKSDLALSYSEVGVLLTVPALVSMALEPGIGLLGDTRYRRALVLGGIIATALALFLVGAGQTFVVILFAFCIMYLASGAYVSLSQATLMDRNLARSEQTMARWTLLGAIGVTISPLLVTAMFGLGYGWRGLYLALAGTAGFYIALLWRVPFNAHRGASEPLVAPLELGRTLLSGLRNSELVRWIVLTELADLQLDKLMEVTGLYFHDVVGVDFAQASAAVAIYSVTGLIGNLLLVPLLERVNGLRLIRFSAVIGFVLYCAFLLSPITWLKFVLIGLIALNSCGWYPILHGRAYAALPGQSGLILAVSSLGKIVSLFIPLLLGWMADAFGLRWAMWLLALGPLALMLGLFREKNEAREES